MTLIIPRIFGGLGNQLFCYAAARRLSLIHNAELVIDDVSGFARDYIYNRQYQLDHFRIPCRKATYTERLEPFSRYRRYLKIRWNQFIQFEKRNYIKQDGIDFEPRLLDIRPKNRVYLEGYWQSESYFKDVERTIREDLQIIPPKDAKNKSTATRISETMSVAIHVRFFKAPIEVGVNNFAREYYERAIRNIELIVPGAHYFVFSDQPDAAREYIPLPDERVTFVAHNQGEDNAYADLWLMSLCRHFIIANSTFSWWGAWLSENSDKTIIAPGFEQRTGLSAWGFKGLIPSEWIKC